MKTRSTFVALLLAAAPALAQRPLNLGSAEASSLHHRTAGFVDEILERQAAIHQSVAAKPTAMVPRLVAKSSRQTTGGFGIDSIRFFYGSPYRGAFHNPKNPGSYEDFFRPVVYPPSHGFDPGYFFRKQYIQHDSMVSYQVVGPVANAYARSTYTYDPSDRPVQHVIDRGPNNTSAKYALTYNAAGQNNYAQRYVSISGGSAANYFLHTNQYTTYDAAGRVLLDSQVSPQNVPGSKFAYTYQFNGLIQQIDEVVPDTPFSHIRMRFIYNPAGLLVKAFSEEYGNGWYQWAVDSFAYSGNNPSYTYRGYFYNPHNTGLVLGYKSEFHLNSAGEWDTIRSYRYVDTPQAGWKFDMQDVITYNAAGNRDRLYYYYGDANNDNLPDALPTGYTQHYYELWDNSLAVADLPKSPGFRLYPNPTSGTLLIGWSSEASPAAYRLSDASGRTVLSGPVLPGASRMELSMGDLPTGLYIFSATDKGGGVLHREKVVRR